MNLIRMLVQYRFDNFMKEYDIKMNDFAYDTPHYIKDKNWKKLKQQLILHNYKYEYDTDAYNKIFCYVAIKNIIWKNIINHEIKKRHNYNTLFLYNNYQVENTLYLGNMNYSYLLNTYMPYTFNTALNDNSNKLQSLVVNYIMLLII